MITLTKAKRWEYEDEWRMFRKFPGPVKYEGKLLKKIILGCKISKEKQEHLINLNKKREVPAMLCRALPKKDEYGLEIQPM